METVYRIRRVGIGICLIVSVLVFRLWSLQFLEGEQYVRQSIANYEESVKIPSMRGRILDRNFNVLAEDRPDYNLFFDKSLCPDKEQQDALLVTLSEITGYSEGFLRSKIAGSIPDLKGRRLLLQAVPFHTMVAVSERALELPGIVMESVPGRHWLHDDLAAHVLGYVSEIDSERLKQLQDQGYRMGDRIGRSGIESSYESWLRGRDGQQIVQLDSFRRLREVLRVESPAERGSDIILNLDLRLQRKAEEVLGASVGVLIAMDPRNGAVLCMAGSPRYNPNTYRRDAGRLSNDTSHPLTHRAIAGLYPPGSVFKIFESFGLLEEGIINQNSREFCPGYFSLGQNQIWRCWRKYGHGNVGIVEALRISCDVFFYKSGKELGITKMARWAENFHLGMKTGIDIPYEKWVPFPSKLTKRPWYAGYTINTAIGQGDVLVTPMQLGVAVSAIANGGTIYAPRVAAGVVHSTSGETWIEPFPPKVTGTIKASPKTWDLVRRGMWEVVNADNGTGRRCQIVGFPMMGKTGTAEKPPLEPHAWYVCFGPVSPPVGDAGLDKDNIPEIVVVFLLEHGGHGGESASPVVKDFLEFYLNGGREDIA